ncbi:MAG: hypothetical protein HQL50_12685 [Magnetococcales bacterium]|nr:hypothetical protein [Magnetococcales bacterium]
MPSLFRRLLLSLLTMLIGLSVGLLLVEGGARLVLDPVDYLKPVLSRHEVLGHAIESGSAHHDRWGFRNSEVPDTVQIVAIGDSNTYGVAATSRNAWPAALARITGKSVYNMGLGGYGPVQYAHLLETKALTLNPEQVIVGLTFGNDFLDGYWMVYGNPHWAHLKQSDHQPATAIANPADSFGPERNPSHNWLGWKEWLLNGWPSQKSVAFRALLYSPLGQIMRVASGRNSAQQTAHDAEHVPFSDQTLGVRTLLTPHLRMQALNPEDPGIQEGVRIALERLQAMAKLCRKRGVGFTVLLFPTKELVVADALSRHAELAHHPTLQRLLAGETRLRARVVATLSAAGIPYVDPLPKLRNALEKGPIYPADHDGHPNAGGYRVIAESVKSFFQ